MKWIAKYNDKTQLSQFNEDGEENLFKDIDQDKLTEFVIGNPYKRLSVDLTTGIFNINGVLLEINNISKRSEEYRLIYFRRVSMSLGTDGGSDKTVKSFIGYQITIDGKNNKVMFSELDGNIILHKE